MQKMTNTDMYRIQVEQMVSDGDLRQASDALTRLLKATPDDGHLTTQAGLVRFRLGNLASARELLETAQVLAPLSPDAEFTLAQCYLEDDLSELATGLLDNVAARPDADCDVLLRTASVLEQLREYRKAWVTCRRAVQLSPDEAQAWFDLSFYMGRVGYPFAQIESVARKAINLDPENISFRTSLASALFQLDRPGDAWRLLENFNSYEIASVRCTCCLERLRLIFESADDWRRVCLCNEQLVLRAAGGDTDCCS